jgi:hypothetical protein
VDTTLFNNEEIGGENGTWERQFLRVKKKKNKHMSSASLEI